MLLSISPFSAKVIENSCPFPEGKDQFLSSYCTGTLLEAAKISPAASENAPIGCEVTLSPSPLIGMKTRDVPVSLTHVGRNPPQSEFNKERIPSFMANKSR